MKILHTSDWHIGRRLKEHDRFDEFRKFFAWLEGIINREKIDVLLAAGDVFDNTTPSVQAQDIYYNFLSRLARSSCRHAVIISGNHDSPAFIDAPSELLELNNIHVIGQACENPEDEIITLNDADNNPELIVCAVPYLRDRDVRTSENDSSNLNQALGDGINHHYERVFAGIANPSGLPVIAMGHLFIHNGRVAQGEGIRSLYVGTALEVESSIFPDYITYTALGHLHSPQTAGRGNIRYSGSPIAMTFGECGTQKSVTIIELNEGKALTCEIPVPVFQRLERISGDMNQIIAEIRTLALADESIWLEITYTGQEFIGDLQERLSSVMKEFPKLEVLSIYNEGGRTLEAHNTDNSIPEGLENINPMQMLEMCFDENNTPKGQRKIFEDLYQEILREMEIDY
ncbi:MAG: exonuclease SbcCD subunit D C-terminal domain-containing protein [Synergistaceae bacterium]|nr:exonuclease SbcCD subunit D C-terminal domain-containing protein [Synergistaceae bacterium]